MDIRNIEYFLHLAKYEHVSVTADLLHISQPSLSKHITSLEREIGVKLFDRIGNRILLNKTGEQIAQYAKQAVELLNAGVNSAKRGIYDTKGGIQIAYTSYAPIIADCIAQYTQINPLITFQIIAFEATKMVDSDQLDFLLSSSAGDTLHDQNKTFWVSRPLFQERYALIYGNRLANALGAGPADLSLLKDEYFVTMAQNDRKDVLFSDITFPLCMNAGYFPKVYCKTDEFLVKVKLVQSDLAVAVLPESCLKDALAIAPGLQYSVLEDEMAKRTIHIMRHKKSLMTEAALDFWEFILDFYGLPQDDLD